MDLKTLEKTVALARLQLTDREKEQFAKQMSSIIDYFEELTQVDTANVEPLVTPTNIEQKLRSDDVQAWAKPSEILDAVPEKQGHLIKVPQVV